MGLTGSVSLLFLRECVFKVLFQSRARDSTPRFVRRSLLFYDFYFWTSLLMPNWSSDLKYGPCPPARDFGSRVSGLVYHPPTRVSDHVVKSRRADESMDGLLKSR